MIAWDIVRSIFHGYRQIYRQLGAMLRARTAASKVQLPRSMKDAGLHP